MKKIVPVFLLAIVLYTKAIAQNEYANQSFYTSLENILDDASKGFPLNRGNMISSSGAINTRYKTSMSLPGADSGFVVNIYTGNTAVFYYLKPARLIQVALERKKNFLEAFKSVTKKEMYKEEQDSYDGETIYRYYSDYAETRIEQADLAIYIKNNGSAGYQISIRIKGSFIPQIVFSEKKNVATFYKEQNLKEKIELLYNDMLQGFENLEKTKTTEDKYAKRYHTERSLFGKKGDLADSRFEIDLSFFWASHQTGSVETAQQIAREFIQAVTEVLAGKMNTNGESVSDLGGKKTLNTFFYENGQKIYKSRYMVSVSVSDFSDKPVLRIGFTKKKN